MILNKIVGTIAIGGAAYLLWNKDSRTKAVNQLKSIASPEIIEKIKSQIPSPSNTKLKGNNNQSKLLESLSDPAFPDYATTERAQAGRA
ncbi:hypothetical protein [Peribacillus glennii]|uniref:Uncharacterized protein n=1 Tax=Peribacillus glennii TaxID=2303991 RepID=A0A372LB31_9BACI|nr:hypothetical protein [Peribacillus glennii]RFU62956.1 hypothetical protein D0466_13500 [Peribacillus glennii]